MLKNANSIINASQIATPIIFTSDVTISTNSADAELAAYKLCKAAPVVTAGVPW